MPVSVVSNDIVLMPLARILVLPSWILVTVPSLLVVITMSEDQTASISVPTIWAPTRVWNVSFEWVPELSMLYRFRLVFGSRSSVAPLSSSAIFVSTSREEASWLI